MRECLQPRDAAGIVVARKSYIVNTPNGQWALVWISLRVHRCDLRRSVMVLILNGLNTILRQNCVVQFRREAHVC